jgi:phosphoglycerol transferase MdoB-like AlkP superfamily enzyme
MFPIFVTTYNAVKPLLKKFLFLFFFWLALFFTGRVLFFICNTSLLSEVSLSSLLQSFYKGTRLDWSMTGYFFVLPFLFASSYLIIQKRILLNIIDGINYIFILLYTLTVAGETCLYREWKSKLSMQALLHFAHPAEVFKSTSTGLTILFFLLWAILFFLAFAFYKRRLSFSKNLPLQNTPTLKAIFIGISFFIVTECYTALSVRGGLQPIPIQCSDAYFSREPILNDAAVNPFWNINYSIAGYLLETKTNPYNYFPLTNAEKTKKFLFSTEKDTTTIFLNTQRPNIVFIILESWSADCISSFGGGNFAPFIDSLCSKGIYFTHLYSAGFSSDQGIPAVISAYPATSKISITQQNTKSSGVPGLNKSLKKIGYESGFIFGGDLNYGNIKSYLYNISFDKIITGDDIDPALPRGRLGVQDEYMAKEYIKMISSSKEPFINCWFTISSHMPYDFPGEKKQLVNHKENNYINSIVYANKALQTFFKAAQKESWYKNTLFVLVSDHSHETNIARNIFEPAYHRIPCVFFGKVIKSEFRGKAIEEVYSQLDIVPTILHQLGMKEESEQYTFGKNMFNPYSKKFAYTSNPSGAAFAFNHGFIGYQHGVNELVISSLKDNKLLEDSLLKYSQSLEQLYFNDYKSR